MLSDAVHDISMLLMLLKLCASTTSVTNSACVFDVLYRVGQKTYTLLVFEFSFLLDALFAFFLFTCVSLSLH